MKIQKTANGMEFSRAAHQTLKTLIIGNNTTGNLKNKTNCLSYSIGKLRAWDKKKQTRSTAATTSTLDKVLPRNEFFDSIAQ